MMVERRIFALGLTSLFLSKVILSLFSHRPLRVRERNKTGFPCFAPLVGALAALSFSTSRAILDVSFHHLRAATSRSIVVADLFRHDVLFLSLFFFFFHVKWVRVWGAVQKKNNLKTKEEKALMICSC